MPEPTTDVAIVDVVVVGGGPAGATAATVLARAGRSVVLVDKATFPRDKCCGDGLTTWALRELDDLGLDPAAVPSWTWVERAYMGSPSRRLVELPLRHGPGAGWYAAVARRVELDAAILAIAEGAGADVRTGVAVTAATTADDGIEVALADGSAVHARWAIAADGMWSPMRKFVGAARPGYRGEWHAFRQYVTGVGPAARELYAWFEPDFLPGYAWSFPLADGTANVGFGILRDGRWPVGAMATLWPEILARPHIASVLGPDVVAEAPHKAWPIPACIGSLPVSHGRVLFVGDAVGAADPLTGEGIGQALATGRWAAEAIRDEPRRAASHYEAVVHDRLHADHVMAETLSRALSHRKGARTAIWVTDRSAWTRRNFARWLFEDYERALVFTPRRWRRGMFTQPGTYRT